jgi:hypothetical protein
MPRPMIFCLDHTNGFFATFFIMCNAYIASKKMGSPFYITHSHWSYTYDQGWHDYFVTLRHPPFIPRLRDPIKVGCDLARFYKPDFPLAEYSTCIRELFVLKPELLHRVSALVATLPSDYIAVFVRRGDKLAEEADYISFADIAQRIPHSDTSTFFIQTDDYGVVEEAMRALPAARIVCTVPFTKRGSFHTVRRSPQQIREETEEMLIGLSVCLRSSSCWSDATSNVGRFLKLANPSVHIYPEDFTVNPSYVMCPAWAIKDPNV